MKCGNCSNQINFEEIHTLNKELIEGVNAGTIEDMTDLQEALYHSMYCGVCCREFAK